MDLLTFAGSARGKGLPRDSEVYAIRHPLDDTAAAFHGLRREGWRAWDAWRTAKIIERANAEILAGRLAIVRIPDDSPDLSWLDQTDEQMGHGFKRQAKAERERAERDGCWGIAAYVRISPNEEWEQADSIWGIIGDDCFGASGYEADILKSGLDLLAKLEANKCPTCGHSRKA